MSSNTILRKCMLPIASKLHDSNAIIATLISVVDSCGTPIVAYSFGSGTVLSDDPIEQIVEQLSRLYTAPLTHQLLLNLLHDGEVLGRVEYRTHSIGELARLDVDKCRRDVHWAAQSLSIARTAEQHERDAQCDALTGLFNRRVFDRELPWELDRAHRMGSNSSVALLIIDIDFFKLVNDTYGHLVGDDALQLVTQNIIASVRSTDLVCRYGGEEFAIIAPETNRMDALELANRIRHSVECAGFPCGAITVSIGLTVSSGNRQAKHVIAAADQGVYRAKNDGRNCVRFTDCP